MCALPCFFSFGIRFYLEQIIIGFTICTFFCGDTFHWSRVYDQEHDPDARKAKQSDHCLLGGHSSFVLVPTLPRLFDTPRAVRTPCSGSPPYRPSLMLGPQLQFSCGEKNGKNSSITGRDLHLPVGPYSTVRLARSASNTVINCTYVRDVEPVQNVRTTEHCIFFTVETVIVILVPEAHRNRRTAVVRD